MNPKLKAVLYRAALFAFVGFVMGVWPVVQTIIQAGPDKFQPNELWWGLLGAGVLGAAGALEKWVAPQLLSVLADEGTTGPVLPVTAAPLADLQVSPAPTPTASSSTGSETAGPARAPLSPQPGAEPPPP